MRVLGIDPGSRVTGWAIVELGRAPRLVGVGALRPRGDELADRLLALRRSLDELVLRERPDAAAVERVFAGKNAQSLITLGEARGVLLVTLRERGLPVAELTPAEIKKTVTGAGNAEKEQVRRMVTALLGGPERGRLGLDAADAAAAALTHGLRLTRRGAVLAAVPTARAVPAETASGSGSSASRWVRRRPAG